MITATTAETYELHRKAVLASYKTAHEVDHRVLQLVAKVDRLEYRMNECRHESLDYWFWFDMMQEFIYETRLLTGEKFSG